MQENSRGDQSMGMAVTWVEPNEGRFHFGPSPPQSDKSCEECLYFNRDLASDEPCGNCYESEDKFNWEKSDGNAEPGEMECSDYRVCEPCST
jgi:hypothetical protein